MVINNANAQNAQGNNSNFANFNLKLGSFNIRGQGAKSEIKLRKVKKSFIKGKYDILFLQETRTDGSEKELKKWQKMFLTKQIFLTNYGTESVGTGIVIRNEETFKVNHSFIDPDGRYVGLVGDHEEGQFLVLGFYSPYLDQSIKDFILNKIYT